MRKRSEELLVARNYIVTDSQGHQFSVRATSMDYRSNGHVVFHNDLDENAESVRKYSSGQPVALFHKPISVMLAQRTEALPDA